MKINLFTLILCFISITSFAQSTMSVEKEYWSGFAIYQNGNKISIKKAKEIAKNNLEVVKKLSSAKTNRTIGTIIGYPGSFAFGYTLGTSLNKNVKSNWTIGGIGAGMMITGMILQGRGNKQLKEAVSEYNTSITKSTTSLFNPEFFVCSSENGIGLSMRF